MTHEFNTNLLEEAVNSKTFIIEKLQQSLHVVELALMSLPHILLALI